MQRQTTEKKERKREKKDSRKKEAKDKDKKFLTKIETKMEGCFRSIVRVMYKQT